MLAGGWLEHEIRSLPQVLACSVTDDDVVVLIQPAADPAAVERAVSDVLRRVGMTRPIRVFGGARAAFAEPVRIRSAARSAFIGAISGAAVLAAGVWIAGAATGIRAPKPRQIVAEQALLPPPIVRDVVRVPEVLPERYLPPAPPVVVPPAQPPGPVARPASPSLLGPVRRPPLLRPLPPLEPPVPPPPPPLVRGDDDDDHDDHEEKDDDLFDDEDDGDDGRDDDDGDHDKLGKGHLKARGKGHAKGNGKGHENDIVTFGRAT